MTVLTCDRPPYCHRESSWVLLVWSRVKDVNNLQDFKICSQNCLLPPTYDNNVLKSLLEHMHIQPQINKQQYSRGPHHIHISLSTLDTSIRVIYICRDITHNFITPVTVQKIKVKHFLQVLISQYLVLTSNNGFSIFM